MIVPLILTIIVILFGFVVFIGAPYVPSQTKFVRQAFASLYPLSKRDLLVDLGSGDGRILRLDSRKGSKAVGYEINPVLAGISRLMSWGDPRVSVRVANFWSVPLPDETTIVYTFTVTRDAKRMARKMQKESNRLQKPLALLTFGATLKDQRPEKSSGACSLYRFTPLQGEKAQV